MLKYFSIILSLIIIPITVYAEFNVETCKICTSQSGIGYNLSKDRCESGSWVGSSESPASTISQSWVYYPDETGRENSVKSYGKERNAYSCDKPPKITTQEDKTNLENFQACLTCSSQPNHGFSLLTQSCETGDLNGSFESGTKGKDKNWVYFTKEDYREKSIAAGRIGDSDSLSCEGVFVSKFSQPGYDTLQILNPVDQISKSVSQAGGCLIATATYGTELAPQVQMLREIRDTTLLGTSSGTSFMVGFNQFYYTFSPAVADWERQNPLFKQVVKTTITPMLSTLSILNHVDINSEQEMFGYGIGIILLNLGMYLAIPTLIIIKTKEKLTSLRTKRV